MPFITPTFVLSELLFRVMTDLTVDTIQSDKAFIYDLLEICNNIYNKYKIMIYIENVWV